MEPETVYSVNSNNFMVVKLPDKISVAEDEASPPKNASLLSISNRYGYIAAGYGNGKMT